MDLDRVIELLNEINNILKETNIEMSKSLVGSSNIKKYVVCSYDLGYLTNKYSMIFGSLQEAVMFNTKYEAESAIQYFDRSNLDIKTIIIKEI